MTLAQQTIYLEVIVHCQQKPPTPMYNAPQTIRTLLASNDIDILAQVWM